MSASIMQICTSNAHAIFHRFVAFVIRKVGYIAWPEPHERELIASKFAFLASQHDGFRTDGSIPKFIGAVDGTYIHINPPAMRRADFINRKGYASFLVQACCTADYRFTHLSNGMPGRMKDPSHYQLSGVDQLIPADFMLLGDAAYGLTTRVLTPYRYFEGYSMHHRRYDYVHSSMRICIEQAFGILKSRWRILKTTLEYTDLRFTVDVIRACFHLHNWVLRDRTDWPDDLGNYEYFIPTPPLSTLRTRIADSLVE